MWLVGCCPGGAQVTRSGTSPKQHSYGWRGYSRWIWPVAIHIVLPITCSCTIGEDSSSTSKGEKEAHACNQHCYDPSLIQDTPAGLPSPYGPLILLLDFLLHIPIQNDPLLNSSSASGIHSFVSDKELVQQCDELGFASSEMHHSSWLLISRHSCPSLCPLFTEPSKMH